MTEQEWEASEDALKLITAASNRYARRHLPNRKARLIATNFLRQLWDLLPLEGSTGIILVAEELVAEETVGRWVETSRLIDYRFNRAVDAAVQASREINRNWAISTDPDLALRQMDAAFRVTGLQMDMANPPGAVR